MRRALYLDATAGETRLEADGPSLIVRQEHCATRRYPLRMLSRIEVRGGISCHSFAIRAALTAGIPIYFLQPGGKLAGAATPAQWEDRSSLPERLTEALMMRSGFREAYEDWVRARTRREILWLERNYCVGASDLREGPFQKALQSRLREALGIHDAVESFELMEELDLESRLWVWDSLAQAGFPAAALQPSRHGFNFVRDVHSIARWRQWRTALEMGRLPVRRPGPMAPATDLSAKTDDRSRRLALLETAEKRRERLEVFLDQLLGDLANLVTKRAARR